MVEAGGDSRFASCVLGDPNALRFGTRLRTCVRGNSPPDYFPARSPLRLQLPHAQKKAVTPYGMTAFFGGGGP